MASRERAEGDLIGCANMPGLIRTRQLDDNRPEHPPLAAMHRHDFTGARRREPHRGQLLVFHEELTAANFIAYGHMHRGAEARVVRAEDGYAVRWLVVVDAARRLAENLKFVCSLRTVHRLGYGRGPTV